MTGRDDAGSRSEDAPHARVVEGVSLLEWINCLLRHRKTLVALPLALAVVVVGWELLQPRTYTSHASFSPAQTGNGQLSQLSGLAARFGVQVPSGAGNRSPQFYSDLMTSEQVLGMTVASHFSIPGGHLTETGATEGSLVEVYGIEEPNSLRARAMAIERLRGSLQVRSDLETSVVRVTVTSPRAEFSQQLAHRLLDAVHRFNLEQRSSQASEEREFLEQRLAAAREDLRTAEDSLRRFLEQNRSFEGSPGLRFEHDRLERRVQMQQQIYTSLQQSLEQAKIEEVRTTPVVTVVQSPTEPAIPDPRRLALKGFLALLLGGVLAVGWALLRDTFERGDWEETGHVREFRRLLDEMRQELDPVMRPVRHVVRRFE